MNKLLVVVPSYKKQGLEFLLESLTDQDQEDLDILVVANGKKSDIIEKYLTKKFHKVKILNAPDHGVQKARDAGRLYAILNEYEYTLFSDQDCIWYPGIISKMVKELDSDKEISGVYTNYKFDNEQIFQSRPYNRQALKTMNFICTMSMWRTDAIKYVQWKESEITMQDWSFAYRATEYKPAKWINDFGFITENPTSKSISGIKGTLSYKASEFRKSVGLPDKDLVITTLGAPTQAQQRAEILDCDFAGSVMGTKHAWYPHRLKFDNWKTVYIMGLFNNNLKSLVNNLQLGYDRHKIVHFIGSDVLGLLENHNFLELNVIREHLNKPDFTLLANSPILQNHLLDMGFTSHLVYTPIYNMHKFEPLLKHEHDFTVGVYYNDNKNVNHFNLQDPFDNLKGQSNLYLIWSVALSCPHIKFKFFGGQAKFTTQNVEFVGRIKEEDMPEFIETTDVMLHHTIFDSYAHTQLKYLLMGKQVLTTTEIPFTHRLDSSEITNFSQAKDEIITKLAMIRDGKLAKPLIQDVRTWLYDIMDEEKYRKIIKQISDNKGWVE